MNDIDLNKISVEIEEFNVVTQHRKILGEQFLGTVNDDTGEIEFSVENVVRILVLNSLVAEKNHSASRILQMLKRWNLADSISVETIRARTAATSRLFKNRESEMREFLQDNKSVMQERIADLIKQNDS